MEIRIMKELEEIEQLREIMEKLKQNLHFYTV